LSLNGIKNACPKCSYAYLFTAQRQFGHSISTASSVRRSTAPRVQQIQRGSYQLNRRCFSNSSIAFQESHDQKLNPQRISKRLFEKQSNASETHSQRAISMKKSMLFMNGFMVHHFERLRQKMLAFQLTRTWGVKIKSHGQLMRGHYCGSQRREVLRK
jgi:hypothetical protein